MLVVACATPAPDSAGLGRDPAATTTGTAGLRSLTEIARAPAGKEEVVLATTTSTQDSGLLEVLVPMFERQTGYRVKPIAVGTGQALALAGRGEADVVLVHAPEAERKWMADGNGTERLLVMHNDFVLVGPPDDPAGIRSAAIAEDALAKVARAGAPFISRGDDSGTHKQELAIWQAAGLSPSGQPWYQEAGQGMGATLNIASEKGAYTLADRGTYLARKATIRLAILVEGSRALLNVYHVMPVSLQKFPKVNAAGGAAFAAFLVTREAQEVIATFGKEKFGQPLFFPDAGKVDEW
ncbi:MAG: substrate-binding domain-containing protein [Chloroflexi bacterium]|nr:substrate-binding domain-containing protein [Chloroflexota bacterium]